MSKHQPPRAIDARQQRSEDPFSHLPPGTTPADYLNYVDRHWDILSSFAYEAYLDLGRGFLLLDWDLSLDRVLSLMPPDLKQSNQREIAASAAQAGSATLLCPILYVGEKGSLFPVFEKFGVIDDRWKALLGRYDPQNSLVLALSWGNTPNHVGNMMVRTLAIAGRPAPADAYINTSAALREFRFLTGSNTAAPCIQDRAIRVMQVRLQYDEKLRHELRLVYDHGVAEFGSGVVVAVPIGDGWVEAVFAPVGDLAPLLEADPTTPQFQAAIATVSACQPDTQVAVVLTSQLGVLPLAYHACCLDISKGGDRA